MTKEELKQEAQIDINNLDGIELVSATLSARDKCGAYKLGRYDGYLASAEPRERRIAELEDKLEQTEKDLADYQFNYPTIKELEKEKAELKKTVTKMNNVITETFSNLTKAKELLKRYVKIYVNPYPEEEMELKNKAEAFLKE